MKQDETRELAELLDALFAGSMTLEHHERLEELLRSSPEALRYYFDYCDVHLKLAELHGSEPRLVAAWAGRSSAPMPPAAPPRRRRLRPLSALAAASAAVAVTAVALLLAKRPPAGPAVENEPVAATRSPSVGSRLWRPAPAALEPAAAPDAVATIETTSGEVFVIADGSRAEARAGDQVVAGGGLSIPARGQASLRLLGASELVVKGPAAITWESPTEPIAGGPSSAVGAPLLMMRIERGALAVRLAAQPAARVVTLVTPHARASVEGARFSLAVADELTRLDVHAGRVLFERLGEGEVTEVPANAVALARGRGSLKTGAAAEPAVAASLPNRPLLDLDFEDGVTPAGFRAGQVVDCPNQAKSRRCLVGTLKADMGTPYRSIVMINRRDRDPVWKHADNVQLSFDYWSGGPRLRLIFYVSQEHKGYTKYPNYELALPDAAVGRWTRAQVRVRDAVADDGTHPREGNERIDAILIMGGVLPTHPLYVDNVRLEAVPSEASKP